MFKALIDWFCGRSREHPPHPPGPGIEDLNRRAPLRDAAAAAPATSTLLCRETLLGRDQRVAGYRFMLRESTRNRIRRSSRIVHHVYAQVLTGSLLQADVARLLGHRSAVVELPDSFLGDDSVRRLPAANTVVAIERIPGEAPAEPAVLLPQIRALRASGHRVALHAIGPGDIPPLLREEINLVIIDSTGGDPQRTRALYADLARLPHHVDTLALNLESLDDFHFFHTLGATWFHGPFITRREDWSEREVAANVGNARPLLQALQQDADNARIIDLLKRSPAITLRLLRHANSAAAGLSREVHSIEDALQLVGRKRLLRWVTMALLTADAPDGRSHAALETSLVRARMLELLGETSGRDAETLFLLGLLSLVDVVMQVELGKALDALAVADDIREALLHGGGEHAPMLRLAEAWERGDNERIETLAQTCGLSSEATAEAYMQALWWALDVTP